MKYLFYGDDTLAIRNRKNQLFEDFLTKNPGGKTIAFSFSDGNITQDIEQELSPGFFPEPKILVIEGLEAQFESNKARAMSLLETGTTYDVIFVEYQNLTKANPFLKATQKKLDQVEVFGKKQRNIDALVLDLENELGLGSLDRRTLMMLKERSKDDGELLLQNVQKVLTYTEGKNITQSELDALVPTTLEVKVFDALDALVSGQKEKALVLFQNLLKQDDVFRILPLCAWQIRQMILVSDAGERHGNRGDSLAKETGIHPFVVQKILRVLPNFSRARLAKGLKILSSIDVDLKQGRRTPEGALQHFLFQW